MLSNLRRKIGLQPGIMNPPPAMPPQFADNVMVSPTFQNSAMMPFSVSDSGFADKNINNPAAIPLWIQEQVGCSVMLSWILWFNSCFFRVLRILGSLSTALMVSLSTCRRTSWLLRLVNCRLGFLFDEPYNFIVRQRARVQITSVNQKAGNKRTRIFSSILFLATFLFL